MPKLLLFLFLLFLSCKDNKQILPASTGSLEDIVVVIPDKIWKKYPDIIKINDSKLEAEKYIFNATKNPKDKGPFPEYTLWYFNNELLKMEFNNHNDKHIITIIRNDWE